MRIERLEFLPKLIQLGRLKSRQPRTSLVLPIQGAWVQSLVGELRISHATYRGQKKAKSRQPGPRDSARAASPLTIWRNRVCPGCKGKDFLAVPSGLRKLRAECISKPPLVAKSALSPALSSVLSAIPVSLERRDSQRSGKRRLTPRCLDSRPALTLIGCRALTNGIESVCAHLGNGDGDDSLHLQNGCEGSRSELMV